MILANKRLEKSFNPIDYNFYDSFVLGVAESNGSKIPKGYIIFALRNKTQIGNVNSVIHSVSGKGVSTEVKKERT